MISGLKKEEEDEGWEVVDDKVGDADVLGGLSDTEGFLFRVASEMVCLCER